MIRFATRTRVNRQLVRTALVSRGCMRAGSTSSEQKEADRILEHYGVKPPTPAYEKYRDEYDKHRPVVCLTEAKGAVFRPRISREAFVAPNATIAGNVEVWDKASVWYGAVVRGDSALVRIGAHSNVQDRCVIDASPEPLGDDHDGSTIIGHFVTIGHRSRLHACTVEDHCLIGIGSVLQPGAYMEAQSMLGAGSVLNGNERVRSRELWHGSPARFVRKLSDAEVANLKTGADEYVAMAEQHKEEYQLPYGTQYQEAEHLGFKPGWTEWPSKERN